MVFAVAMLAGAVPPAWLTREVYHAMSEAVPPSTRRFPVAKSDDEWQASLSPKQYAVLRLHDTEYPGTSPLLEEHRDGRFVCAGCGQPLFLSATKYESGSGWPSFYDAIDGAVGTSEDRALGMRRVEIHCSRCGGHLGHVFPDGPRPTGERYCTNGAALTFEPSEANTERDGSQGTGDRGQGIGQRQLK
jgi:peptide-methionine (R)-S-oxide reductase